MFLVLGLDFGELGRVGQIKQPPQLPAYLPLS
jgi:hypothetical protein